MSRSESPAWRRACIIHASDLSTPQRRDSTTKGRGVLGAADRLDGQVEVLFRPVDELSGVGGRGR